MKFVFFVLILFYFSQKYVISDGGYCRLSLCRVGKHVGCGEVDFGRKCIGKPMILNAGSFIQEQILRLHNSFRNSIAIGDLKGYQPATRMAKMVYNEELGDLALLNAKSCEVKHDECRNTEDFKYVGQNLASLHWTHKNQTALKGLQQIVNGWFSEYRMCGMDVVDKYRLVLNKKTKRPVCENMMQMAQEKATEVGCGIVYGKGKAMSYIYVTCNYSRGNIPNRLVYRKGNPASECKTGQDAEYKALCSSKEQYDINVTLE